MTALDASFEANGRAANIVEPGDIVDIVFTAPPPSATDVRVELIEAPGDGDQVRTDRLIATFSGQITGGKFKLDVPFPDPLDPTPPPPNPAPGNFNHSSDPPKIPVRFKDDPSKKSDVTLPDVEEENGSYELKLRITGKVNGAPVTSTGGAILHLSVWRDVMIVPDIAAATAAQKKSEEFKLFINLAGFAQQWRKYAGARRSVMTMPIDCTMADFERVVAAAAAKAVKGDVLLDVGHGGTEGSRGLASTVFDATPNSTHGIANHPNAINSEVLSLPFIATKNAAGQWIANDPVNQPNIGKLVARFEALSRVGAILKQNKVARFIVVTCNMSKDANFGPRLAKVMQVPAGGYLKSVLTDMVQPTGTTSFVQIWLSDVDPPVEPDPNQPPFNDPTTPSFHEIPGGLRTFQP
jgi:hypothetical protein